MKTSTFARLSLLIPFLVWGICLLLVLLVNALFPDSFSSSETFTLSSVVGLVLIFYLIGIPFWLVPYLLVALVLLILSFRSRPKVLKTVSILSPFAMAMLVMIELTTLSMNSLESSLPTFDLSSISKDSIGAIAMFVIITIFWGYLCVGIGLGLYKLFRHYGIIKDEMQSGLMLQTINQPEL